MKTTKAWEKLCEVAGHDASTIKKKERKLLMIAAIRWVRCVEADVIEANNRGYLPPVQACSACMGPLDAQGACAGKCKAS